jgi:hypothetical protein
MAVGLSQPLYLDAVKGQGDALVRDATYKGRIRRVVQGTHHPRDASSKGRTVQGTRRLRDAMSKGRIVQGTEHPRLFARKPIGRGHFLSRIFSFFSSHDAAW